MQEPLLDRIAQLERSNRRWKWTAGILTAALIGVTGSGTLLGIYGFNHRLHELEEQARARDMLVRAEALLEARVRQAEAARKAAEMVAPPRKPDPE